MPAAAQARADGAESNDPPRGAFASAGGASDPGGGGLIGCRTFATRLGVMSRRKL